MLNKVSPVVQISETRKKIYIFNNSSQTKLIFLSCGRVTLILTSLGASFFTSLNNRSPKPARNKDRVSVLSLDGELKDTFGWSLRSTFEKRWATRQHYVREERASQIHVWLLNGESQHLMNTLALVSNQIRPEEKLWSPEPCWADLQEIKPMWVAHQVNVKLKLTIYFLNTQFWCHHGRVISPLYSNKEK